MKGEGSRGSGQAFSFPFSLSSRSSLSFPLLVFLFLFLQFNFGASARVAKKSTDAGHVINRKAYVSYVANDAYTIGGRVLGASLRESGTKHDLIMMVTSFVSQRNKELMASDGWLLREVTLIENPFLRSKGGPQNDEERFTFAKLHIWNNTALDGVTVNEKGESIRVHYEKVIFLDADIVVLTNIDYLFNCGTGLCGHMGKAYSDMWNINVGVLVLTPSTDMLNDMLHNAMKVGSNYKLGEAGFINKYFLHYCVHKQLLSGVPVTQLQHTYPVGDFSPPYYIPGQNDEEICLNLKKIHNWRWSNDVGSTLIGNVLNDARYNSSVEILHFNGELKPWLWRLYPMHGWFRYWNQYTAAASLPLADLYWEHTYTHLLLIPLACCVVLWLVAQTPLFVKYTYTLALHYGKSRLYSSWMLRHSELVLIPYSVVVAVVVPVVLYLYEGGGGLPRILPISIGWLLFFEWSLFVFWLWFGPLCLYYYWMGFALVVSASTWQGGGPIQQPQQPQQQQPQQPPPQQLQYSRFWFTKEWMRSSVGYMVCLGALYLVLFYVVPWECAVYRAVVLMLYPTAVSVWAIVWVSLLPIDCLRMAKVEAIRLTNAAHNKKD